MPEEAKENVKVPKKVIAARLVIFAVTVAWVLGWLAIGLFLHPVFLSAIAKQILDGNIVDILNAWYVITFIVIGAFVAIRGFRFVGKWERE